MLTTAPDLRWAMAGQGGGQTAWGAGARSARQTIMVPMRLLSRMARTSSMGTPRPLLGLGLPPRRAMSPPALLTRMETGPRVFSIWATIEATAASSAMLPQTAVVLAPLDLLRAEATSSMWLASPNSAQAVGLMSWR